MKSSSNLDVFFEIRELDINPLIVNESQAVAVDVRCILGVDAGTECL